MYWTTSPATDGQPVTSMIRRLTTATLALSLSMGVATLPSPRPTRSAPRSPCSPIATRARGQRRRRHVARRAVRRSDRGATCRIRRRRTAGGCRRWRPSCAPSPRRARTTSACGMYATGRICDNDRLADLGLHGTEALIVGELVAGVIKGVVGRQRPSVQPRNSGSYQLGSRPPKATASAPSRRGIRRRRSRRRRRCRARRRASGRSTRWVIGPIPVHGGRAHRRLADVQQPSLDERRPRRRGGRYLRRPQGRTLSPLASGQPARPVAAERLALSGARRGTGAALVDRARACRIHLHHAPPLSTRRRVVHHA